MMACCFISASTEQGLQSKVEPPVPAKCISGEVRTHPPPAAKGLFCLNLSPNFQSRKGAGTPKAIAMKPSRELPHPNPSPYQLNPFHLGREHRTYLTHYIWPAQIAETRSQPDSSKRCRQQLHSPHTLYMRLQDRSGYPESP